MLRFLEVCRKRNIPIKTVGLQSHLTHKIGRDGYEQQWREWRHFLQEIEDMGYRIAITELDASDADLDGLSAAERDLEIERAVKDYLDITFDVRTLTDVVCWGLSDIHTYHNAKHKDVRALPYDDHFRLKPMGRAIINAMNDAPERA